jgi:hypothetical protein
MNLDDLVEFGIQLERRGWGKQLEKESTSSTLVGAGPAAPTTLAYQAGLEAEETSQA